MKPNALDADHLAALIKAARAYADDLDSGLADGLYDHRADLDRVRAALAHFEAPPPAFDPARVKIERRRISTTQGTVGLSYEDWYLGSFADTIELRSGGRPWQGAPDSDWIETARRWFAGEIPDRVLQQWAMPRVKRA
jgi:hypothetical protein